VASEPEKEKKSWEEDSTYPKKLIESKDNIIQIKKEIKSFAKDPMGHMVMHRLNKL
jgi:hypothetical protein